MTGFGNKERHYYACESYRRGGRKHSDCPLLKKEPLEQFVMDVIKDKIFTPERIKGAIDYLQKTTKLEKQMMIKESTLLKKDIRKIDLELKNFHKAIADGMPAKHLVEPIEDREKRKAGLQEQLEEI